MGHAHENGGVNGNINYMMGLIGIYPLVNGYITMENHMFLMGKSTNYTWPFSIAMLNYQRVKFGMCLLLFNHQLWLFSAGESNGL
jgi:hypothetical protein